MCFAHFHDAPVMRGDFHKFLSDYMHMRQYKQCGQLPAPIFGYKSKGHKFLLLKEQKCQPKYEEGKYEGKQNGKA